MDKYLAFAHLIVDSGREAEAVALARAWAEPLGGAGPWRWKPYPKLGDHSKVSFFLEIPGPQEAALAAIEAVCADLVGEDALGQGYVIEAPNDDGTMIYERVFDARTTPFRVPALLWLHIDLNTYPDAQADMRAFRAGRGAG